MGDEADYLLEEMLYHQCTSWGTVWDYEDPYERRVRYAKEFEASKERTERNVKKLTLAQVLWRVKRAR